MLPLSSALFMVAEAPARRRVQTGVSSIFSGTLTLWVSKDSVRFAQIRILVKTAQSRLITRLEFRRRAPGLGCVPRRLGSGMYSHQLSPVQALHVQGKSKRLNQSQCSVLIGICK
jgi:hypothetical protein